MTAHAQHIVIVFHDFSFGGTEDVALRLAREWQRHGRRITILCGTLDGPLRGSVPAGVQVRTLDQEIGRSPLSRLRLRRALPAAIDRLRADILFLPGNFHLVLGRAAKGLAQRPKVVAKISNPLAPTSLPPLRWLVERLYRWAARDADMLVAMSSGLADDIQRLTDHHKTRVIHDPNTLSSEAAPQHVPDRNVLRMVAAGRLVAQKDFALAIRVTAELACFRKVHLTVLGEGPERPRLERLVRKLGMENSVALPGHRPSIAPALSRADLLLVTSHYEGGPAVAVEALHQNVPVLATACSHFLKDLIDHPDHGTLFMSRRPKAIALEILDWIDHPDRKSFCGQSVTAPLETRHVARSYLDLFDSLVENHEPHSMK